MALTKEVVVDRMEILEDGQIQIRTATRIKEDGVVLSQSYHRRVIEPGQDVSQETQKVKDVCNVLYTKDVVDAYIAEKEKKKLPVIP